MEIQPPENANEHCPGPESEMAGKDDNCAGCPNQKICESLPKGPDPDIPVIAQKLSGVKHKILVLSGKGGVGKSTVASQLAFQLSQSTNEDPEVLESANDLENTSKIASNENEESDLPYNNVGLLDIDITGPSIPIMTGCTDMVVHESASGWVPVYVRENLAVMSIGFLLDSEDSAVIWRGPKKSSLIKQFLRDVDWTDSGDDDGYGDSSSQLDYLIVDTPPGTTDEHLSIVQYLRQAGIDGAVLVTTPQEVSLQDVRKEIDFCRKAKINIIGVIENMAGFVCPHCSHNNTIFTPTTGGAAALCAELNLNFLGQLPLDPRIGRACDSGEQFTAMFPDSLAAVAYKSIVSKIIKLLN
ncbi:hypothetical protein BB560_000821 [Smittium megazygosporum]|uniref:Uncharacterized protein n=1 Tax=Smittium megazygosporum TaxID=133381 RepID=A0A2T9ZJ86_9FUNG|nr:hypothetical protein BB560_006083 [Smittium megazygosporum]PVV04665.1 hypothetical protein BB560_000821 [Smittium megazygosporum]